MFTGLISEIGMVTKAQKIKEGLRFTISSKDLISELKLGDSIAINGVCQTVVGKSKKYFSVIAVKTTLEKTNFKSLKEDSSVNLELPLRLQDRMGGHFVSGHVNGITKVKKISKNGKNYNFTFSTSKESKKYLINEGSITLNGVSLTVASVEDKKNEFIVTIIPHTLSHTTFGLLKVGDEINFEVDILAKYLERMTKVKS
jgi:riboflavin synthase